MIDGKSWPGRSVLCVVGLLASMRLCAAEATDDRTADNGWRYKAEAYGWLPTIESTLPTGDELELDIEDILDYLEFTFMGAFKASKGKWCRSGRSTSRRESISVPTWKPGS
jgi:hypothetical protein